MRKFLILLVLLTSTLATFATEPTIEINNPTDTEQIKCPITIRKCSWSMDLEVEVTADSDCKNLQNVINVMTTQYLGTVCPD